MFISKHPFHFYLVWFVSLKFLFEFSGLHCCLVVNVQYRLSPYKIRLRKTSVMFPSAVRLVYNIIPPYECQHFLSKSFKKVKKVLKACLTNVKRISKANIKHSLKLIHRSNVGVCCYYRSMLKKGYCLLLKKSGFQSLLPKRLLPPKKRSIQ